MAIYNGPRKYSKSTRNFLRVYYMEQFEILLTVCIANICNGPENVYRSLRDIYWKHTLRKDH